MSAELLQALGVASAQTLWMVLVATAIAVLLGLPLGLWLFTLQQPAWRRPGIYRLMALIVNVIRSIPFIILMVAVTPFTLWVTGTTIGTPAAIVPLCLSATPFFARCVESALLALPEGIFEMGRSLGASYRQIMWRMALPEALPELIRAVTLLIVTMVGYSAMAGAVGGGGLGDLAIRYGYQRFQPLVMGLTVLLLVLFVQGMQWWGDCLSRRFAHEEEE